MSGESENKKDFIALSKAAREIGYAQGYLSNLVRSGELKAEKIGRNWYTTNAWLKDYLDSGKKKRKPKEEFKEIYRKFLNEETPENVKYPAQKRKESRLAPVRLAAVLAVLFVIVVTSAKIARDDLMNPQPEKILGEETQAAIQSTESGADQNQLQPNFINLNSYQSQIAQNFLGSFYLIENLKGNRYANGDISYFPDYGLKLRMRVVGGKNIDRRTIETKNLASDSVNDRVLDDDVKFHIQSLDIEDNIDIGGDLNIEGDIYQNGSPFTSGIADIAEWQALCTNCVNLTDDVTGTLPVANGGTGTSVAPTNGQILIGNGTGFTLSTLTAGANITITNAAGSITIASAGGGAFTSFDVAGDGGINQTITDANTLTIQGGDNITTTGVNTDILEIDLDGTLAGVTWQGDVIDEIYLDSDVIISGDNISLLTNDSGFITDGNTNWDNSYGFITASSADALTNKTGNISMWTNDSGYITASSVDTLTNKTWNGGTINTVYGGTGLSSYTTGDILYYSSGATLSKLAAVAAGSILQSGGVATAPSWTTATYPGSTTANRILYSSSDNVVGQITSTASSILVTNDSSAPSWATDIPTAVTIGGTYIYRAGGTDVAVTDGGTGAGTAIGARTNLGAAASGANSDITSLSGLTTALSVAQGGTNSATALNNNRIMVSSGGAIVEAGAMTNGQLLIGSTSAAPVVAALTQGSGITITNGAGSISIASTLGTSVDLTSEVTGTLPVANGGTGTATAFTAGSVVFAGASGIYSQDNSNFFWDATNHRLGIGTTSPAQKLHVEGQCVTGNSLLSIFNENTDQIEKRRIDQIKGGEYVLSLDEKTGKLIPAKIKGLLNMGVKPIYEVETEDGKKIRTTGNHPYLAKSKNLGFSGIVKQDQDEERGQNNPGNDVKSKGTHSCSVTSSIHNNDIADDENNTDDNISDQQIVHNFDLGKILSPRINVPIASSTPTEKVGTSKLIPANPGTNIDTNVEPTSNLDKSIKYSDAFSSCPSDNFISFSNCNTTKLHNSVNGANWTKVSELSEGDEIAVTSKKFKEVKFAKIKEIEILPPEQVYDIEVEGTHNFVANGIIAHNTYISGNVGIGTTGPGYKLDIAGDIGMTGDIYNTTAGFMLNNNGAGIDIDTDNNDADTRVIRFTKHNSAVDLMDIYESGNVGIGTTSPGYKLDVNGTVNATYYYGDGSNLTGISGSISGLTTGKITKATSATTIGDSVIAEASGNVGIGTTGPDAQLHVYSSSSADPRGIIVEHNQDNIAAGVIDIEKQRTTGISSLDGDYIGTFRNIFYNDAATPERIKGTKIIGYVRDASDGTEDVDLIFNTYVAGTDTEIMRFKESNVGIGTTGPGVKLHVYRSTGVADSKIESGDNYASLGLKGGQAGDAEWLLLSGYPNAGDFTLREYGVGNYVTVKKTTGNVGIGTTTPGAPLHVRSAASASLYAAFDTTTANYGAGLQFMNAGTAKWYLFNAGSASDKLYIQSSAGDTRFVIQQDGNVGIGTASPGAKLDVRGTIYQRDATSGTLTFSLSSDNYYTYISSEGNRILYLYTGGNNNDIYLAPNGTGRTIIQNGNVGIGTTGPASKLAISGNGNSGWQLYIKGQGATSATYGIVHRASDESTDNFWTRDDGNGYLRAAAWTYGSDRRLKENIADLDYGLNEILALNPIRFDYINGQKNQLGFIAQEVQDFIPEIVDKLPNGMLGLKTDLIIPVLTNAIKEQQGQITNLTTNDLQLTTNISDLTSHNSLLASSVSDLVLKTDANIETLKDLQKSVDKNLSAIESQLTGLRSLASKLNFEIEGHETRIKSVEDLTVQLQTQIDELKKLANAELNLAQIEQNKNDIEYLKLLLGVDRAENGSISLLGNLEAEGIVAGVFTVKVSDETKKTLGQAKIEAGKTEANVKTEAVGENSRVFVTADQPVKIGVSNIDSNDGFTVKIDEELKEDLHFSWWVVDESR